MKAKNLRKAFILGLVAAFFILLSVLFYRQMVFPLTPETQVFTDTFANGGTSQLTIKICCELPPEAEGKVVYGIGTYQGTYYVQIENDLWKILSIGATIPALLFLLYYTNKTTYHQWRKSYAWLLLLGIGIGCYHFDKWFDQNHLSGVEPLSWDWLSLAANIAMWGTVIIPIQVFLNHLGKVLEPKVEQSAEM